MQNEQGPKQPPRSPDGSANRPQTQAASQPMPGVQDSSNEMEELGEAVVIPPSLPPLPGRIQDRDWNNGKPESTSEQKDTLSAHKADQEISGSPKDGNIRPGDDKGEASDEVVPDQNSG